MTNKEAIEVLQSMKSDFPLPKAAQTRRVQNDALDVAIEALKAESCEDTVSRQAALNSPVTMVSDGLDWIPAYHIKDLPSAQPDRKHGKWIYHIDDIFPAESTMECDQCPAEQPLTCDDEFCPHCGARMEGDK